MTKIKESYQETTARRREWEYGDERSGASKHESKQNRMLLVGHLPGLLNGFAVASTRFGLRTYKVREIDMIERETERERERETHTLTHSHRDGQTLGHKQHGVRNTAETHTCTCLRISSFR